MEEWKVVTWSALETRRLLELTQNALGVNPYSINVKSSS